ncbi:MAG: tRNA pseudouridine(38-40) synthase TruA [Gemmataceae bacterium]
MRNLKLIVQYDGTAYSGWQTQPGYATVQETLEQAISAITQEPRIRCNASGRTDSGVHALGQVVNFFSGTRLSPEVLRKAINAKLPDDVRVSHVAEVPQSFDANRDAVRKRYRYVVNDARVADPFLRKLAWQTLVPLDAELMHTAGQALVGRHDFRCFETHYPNRLTSIRTIYELAVTRHGPTLWVDVEADGFLYNMVRAITGTLYQVGRGYWRPEQVLQILQAMDRKQAGPNAPPQGLFLLYVKYSDESLSDNPPQGAFFSTNI